MDIRPSVSAIRSIGAAFAHRLYVPVAIITAVTAAIFIAISLWLVTLNEWWLILLILVCGLTLFAGILLAVGLAVINGVAPAQSKAQKMQTKLFVDKLLRVAEVTSTPKAILLFQAMKDIIRPSSTGFIGSISTDTKSLKRDYIALQDSFRS